MSLPSYDDVLHYWFGELPADGSTPADKGGLWWGGGPEIDAEITERFGALHESLCRDDHGWPDTAQARLARLVVLDQFSRNIHRGTPRAFAQDPVALGIALDAIERGWDKELATMQRTFLYMPLMHSEDRAVHQRSVQVFTALADEVSPAVRGDYEPCVKYAVMHKELVDEFGRYPHRNEILGRESTAAEAAHMAAGGESFGQSKG